MRYSTCWPSFADARIGEPSGSVQEHSSSAPIVGNSRIAERLSPPRNRPLQHYLASPFPPAFFSLQFFSTRPWAGVTPFLILRMCWRMPCSYSLSLFYFFFYRREDGWLFFPPIPSPSPPHPIERVAIVSVACPPLPCELRLRTSCRL